MKRLEKILLASSIIALTSCNQGYKEIGNSPLYLHKEEKVLIEGTPLRFEDTGFVISSYGKEIFIEEEYSSTLFGKENRIEAYRDLTQEIRDQTCEENVKIWGRVLSEDSISAEYIQIHDKQYKLSPSFF